MAAAAIDRLVHHAIIPEMITDSHRRRSAEARATLPESEPPFTRGDDQPSVPNHRRRSSQLTRTAHPNRRATFELE
jgi:hypothetical protein